MPNSKVEPVNSKTIDYAGDNTPHGRLMASNSVYHLTLIHSYISYAQLTTIRNFWNTNKSATDITLTFPNDGLTYTCQLLKEPSETNLVEGEWDVQVELVGTRS